MNGTQRQFGNTQKGLSLLSMALLGVAFALVAILGAKCFPVVTEYLTIQKEIRATASDISLKGATVGDFRAAFNKRADVAYIKAITGQDLEITKENDLTRDPNGGPYDLIQAGETRSSGVELETRYLFTDALMALLSTTWLDMEITKDTRGLEGKTPVWVPDVTASLWLQYDLFDGPAAGTTLGAGVRYVGEMQIDALNTGEVPDYTVFDLAASYDLGRVNPSLRGTTLQLTANNLTDHRYVTCYDRNNCWFGAERMVEVGVQYDF